MLTARAWIVAYRYVMTWPELRAQVASALAEQEQEAGGPSDHRPSDHGPSDHGPSDVELGAVGVRATGRLRALSDFVRTVSAARSLEHMLRLAAQQARRAMLVDSLTLSRWEPDVGLRVLVSDGRLGPWELPGAGELIDVTASACRAALVSQSRPFVVDLAVADLAADSAPADFAPADFAATNGQPMWQRDASLAQWVIRRRKASAVAVPLLVDGLVWGELIGLRQPGRQGFNSADVRFAQAVSAQVSAGVTQAERLLEVKRWAFTDALTGLANRREFEERLREALAELDASGTGVAVLMADLNGLKTVNDNQGHEAGDELIRAFAVVLTSWASQVPGALAARIGGDEFAVLLRGQSAEAVMSHTYRLCRSAHEQLPHGVAVGVACSDDFDQIGGDSGRLLRAADHAQYRAKRSRSRAPSRAVAADGARPPDGAPTAARDIGIAAPRRAVRAAIDPGAVLQTCLDAVAQGADAAASRDLNVRLTGVLLGLEALSQALPDVGWRVEVDGACVAFGEPATPGARLDRVLCRQSGTGPPGDQWTVVVLASSSGEPSWSAAVARSVVAVALA